DGDVAGRTGDARRRPADPVFGNALISPDGVGTPHERAAHPSRLASLSPQDEVVKTTRPHGEVRALCEPRTTGQAHKHPRTPYCSERSRLYSPALMRSGRAATSVAVASSPCARTSVASAANRDACASACDATPSSSAAFQASARYSSAMLRSSASPSGAGGIGGER